MRDKDAGLLSELGLADSLGTFGVRNASLVVPVLRCVFILKTMNVY